jgi:hypothetical protein
MGTIKFSDDGRLALTDIEISALQKLLDARDRYYGDSALNKNFILS